MSVFHDNALIGASSQRGYQISRSLRFSSADSAYLVNSNTRTVAASAYTFSFWIKRCVLGNAETVWSSEDASGASSKFALAGFGPDNIFYWWHYSSADANAAQSNGVLRDPSAWYHIVISKPASTAGTLYINGVAQTKQTSFTTDADAFANAKYIGRRYDGTRYSNCYLTEFYGIDGQALTPSSFGETDTITGVWKPKKYAGTYGTNGFYLNFADNSGTTSTTLGKDSSGNGNNWTPNNFSVTAGAGNDSLVDSPTLYGSDTGAGGEIRGNYCTLNPLNLGSSYLSDGNLKHTGSGWSSTSGTIAVSTGKWYWEVTCAVYGGSNYTVLGIVASTRTLGAIETGTVSDAYVYSSNGYKYNNNTGLAYGATYTTNDVIGVALDIGAGTLTFYKNGVSQGTAYSGLSGAFAPCLGCFTGGVLVANFGQRPFAYTAPSGFKALCTTNLPEPTLVKGSSYMDTLLYTGNGSARSITGLNFSPDLVWIKNRSSAISHGLNDSVRGAGKFLYSNLTDAEADYPTDFASFDSGGFSLGTGTGSVTNTNGSTYVAWCWDAGSSTVTNTSGTISSQVRANASAGFSVVTYTGTLSSTPGTAPTVGHGLGVKPALIISKSRNNGGGETGNWLVIHSYNYNKFMRLNGTGSESDIAGSGGGPAADPTSTVFSTYYVNGGNISGATYVAYCFSAVAGYSAFGSYTGNGSTDGPFVLTGFRPRWILVKVASTTGSWYILDTARNEYNTVSRFLYPDLSNAEVDGGSGVYVDFLSNGFKWRSSASAFNGSSSTYIYAAFAENPFKFSLAR
jgi:hypothetical protein